MECGPYKFTQDTSWISSGVWASKLWRHSCSLTSVQVSSLMVLMKWCSFFSVGPLNTGVISHKEANRLASVILQCVSYNKSWQAMCCELWQANLTCFIWVISSLTALSVTLTDRRQANDKQSCNPNVITRTCSCWLYSDANKQNTSFPNYTYPYLLRVNQQKHGCMLHYWPHLIMVSGEV